MESDRVLFLLVGIIIGYVLGRITNDFHRPGKEPASMPKKDNDEPKHFIARFRQLPGVSSSNIALLLILGFTVWAAFTAQSNANKSDDQTRVVAKLSDCNAKFLNDTISALTSRTANSPQQSQANLNYVNAQAEFFASINPTSPTIVSDYATALSAYQRAYTAYVTATQKQQGVVITNDYPTPDEFNNCINSK